MDTPTQIDDGGPAFARGSTLYPNSTLFTESQTGMTLRDWFAGQALAALIAQDPKTTHAIDNPNGRPWDDWITANAYGIADSMIAARRK